MKPHEAVRLFNCAEKDSNVDFSDGGIWWTTVPTSKERNWSNDTASIKYAAALPNTLKHIPDSPKESMQIILRVKCYLRVYLKLWASKHVYAMKREAKQWWCSKTLVFWYKPWHSISQRYQPPLPEEPPASVSFSYYYNLFFTEVLKIWVVKGQIMIHSNIL